MFILGEKGSLKYRENGALTANGLIGSKWTRRELEDDAYDYVHIVGLFPVLDGYELVYRPAVEFGEALTANVDSFVEHYTREDETLTRLRDVQSSVERLRAQTEG